MIRKFASELESWLQAALEDLPENLRAVKIDCKNLFPHLNRKTILIVTFWWYLLHCYSGQAFLSHAPATKFT